MPGRVTGFNKPKGKLMSSGKRVLLIEDHDDSRELLAALLRRSGFEVFAYDRCRPAERHLEAGDIDVALLDVRIPDRCGDDFGAEIRQRCTGTMIVFVTGEALVDHLKVAVPDCFVIRKPIDIAVLLELLECFRGAKGYAATLPQGMTGHARPGNI